MALLGSLALIGLFARRAPGIARVALLLLALLPLGLLFAFNLYRDAYLKFLLVCVAPLMLLAANGVDWLATQAARLHPRASALTAVALCVGIAALFAPSLQNLYGNPVYARDDYRGIYRQIQNANPNSVVVFNAPNQWEVFTYYQKSDKNLHPLHYRPGSAAEAAQQLERIVFGAPDVFVLYYAEREADPNGWYERWLGENAHKLSEQWVGNIRLARYAGTAAFETLATNIAFGDAIVAERVEADLSRADGVIPVRIRWRANRTLTRNYKVFVHLGPADAPPIAQNDGEPAAGARPTSGWAPGATILDLRGVVGPPNALATNGLFIGLYDAATGERLGERVRVR